MLEENINRISEFVKEFLDFARGNKPEVTFCDPNEIAQKVIDLFQDRAAIAEIKLNIEMQSNIKNAALDAEGIHVCISNLISNAIDACEMSENKNNEITLLTRNVDDELVYEVADNGCGMDYDIKQKVFNNFFSTKGSGKGTGLGLLTTRKIVQEHGGLVSFESTVGEGSTFSLIFPRSNLPALSNKNDD